MERRVTEDTIHFIRPDGQEAAAMRETVKDGQVLVQLSGTFSGELANDLLDELSSLVIAGMGVTVDAEKAEYFSPSISQVFLRINSKLEEKNAFLRIVNLPMKLYQEFEKTGVHAMLEIEVAK